MASTFPLDIVTPERTVLSDSVASVQLPAVGGSMGILKGHAPLLTELGVGECIVRNASGETHQLVIAGGFVDVSGEKVTVLADTAEFADEIDVSRAEAALARARAMLGTVEDSSQREAASAAVRRAQARLRIARGGS